MQISFHKYQGTGNDFVIIDNRKKIFPKQDISLIRRLCDRHFGIGADGLILIENHDKHDYRMVYFNSDGSESLCGNGSRCGFAFAGELGIVDTEATFITANSIHRTKYVCDTIHFQLSDNAKPEHLPNGDWYIDTGSPHHIVEVEKIADISIIEQARSIRYGNTYADRNGTNVNFAKFLGDGVEMRTYERGVENETLSCGTGAVAVALVAAEKGMSSPVELKTRGGMLRVFFDKTASEYRNIWLVGAAEKVYEGTCEI